jgi:hypothetical protein
MRSRWCRNLWRICPKPTHFVKFLVVEKMRNRLHAIKDGAGGLFSDDIKVHVIDLAQSGEV